VRAPRQSVSFAGVSTITGGSSGCAFFHHSPAMATLLSVGVCDGAAVEVAGFDVKDLRYRQKIAIRVIDEVPAGSRDAS
jgi:hypothetical protein